MLLNKGTTQGKCISLLVLYYLAKATGDDQPVFREQNILLNIIHFLFIYLNLEMIKFSV